MRIEFTDYDVWSFLKDDAGGWKWCRRSPDGELLIEARGAFSTLEQCQEDARRSGYSTQAAAPE